MKSAQRERKAPVHLTTAESGNRSTIIFVTVCTKERKPILAADKAHEILAATWNAPADWAVGRYIILPDHIHLFCAPYSREHEKLTTWMSRWKAEVSRNWHDTGDKPLWQRSFWDRQLRRSDSYTEKWRYVQNNPVRHKLVNSADDWPYQGEINKLYWHD